MAPNDSTVKELPRRTSSRQSRRSSRSSHSRLSVRSLSMKSFKIPLTVEDFEELVSHYNVPRFVEVGAYFLCVSIVVLLLAALLSASWTLVTYNSEGEIFHGLYFSCTTRYSNVSTLKNAISIEDKAWYEGCHLIYYESFEFPVLVACLMVGVIVLTCVSILLLFIIMRFLTGQERFRMSIITSGILLLCDAFIFAALIIAVLGFTSKMTKYDDTPWTFGWGFYVTVVTLVFGVHLFGISCFITWKVQESLSDSKYKPSNHAFIDNVVATTSTTSPKTTNEIAAAQNAVQNNTSFLSASAHVGDNVRIGDNCVICPGVTIGNNVIIGAGSVVTHDLPDGVIALGNPAIIAAYMEERK